MIYTVLTDNYIDEKLNSSARILDAYDISPILKPHERGSKEFLRRSNDINTLSGNASFADIQSTDPVFTLKRANRSAPHSPRQLPRATSGNLVLADELDQQLIKRSPNLVETDSSVPSMYETPTTLDDISPDISPHNRLATSPSGGSPSASYSPERTRQQEIIAAQRAASLASQRLLLSSQRNAASRGLPDEPRAVRTNEPVNRSTGTPVDRSETTPGGIDTTPTQNHKSKPIKYAEETGVNLLMAIIEHGNTRIRSPRQERSEEDNALDDLFGPKLAVPGVSDEAVKLFESQVKAIDELDWVSNANINNCA